MTLNLPLYNITPDMTDENQGMFLVSLVEEPAVEIDFLAFAKENMLFAVQDTEKHIVTGVSILADTPIYRRNQNGEFYVQFRKEDIPAIVEKFMQRGLSNFINIQHDETTLSNTDAVLVESYFVNKERGIVPNEFANVTDGSWITSYKILNEDIWQQIKDGDLKGFSIEISAELEPVKLEKQRIENAITVPSEAIVPEMGVDKLYLYRSGKAQPVTVTTGIRTDGAVQIVSGISQGDTIIVSGTLQLRMGLPVKLDNVD